MNHKTPLFSIIIPTYNYAEYIEGTIQSVLQQQGNDYELIVINDGSTDNTDKVIKKFLSNRKNAIRYFLQENKGVSATRNKGIDLAKGRYLYFLDSDDKMLNGSLDIFREAIKNHSYVDMLIARYFSVYENGKRKARCLWKLTESKERNFKNYLLSKDNSLLCSSILFKKTVFANYRFPEHLRLYEDEPVFAYILANFNALKVEKEVALVQKHEGSLRHKVYHGLVERSVDEIFNEQRIPPSFMKYRSAYLCLKKLDQFRTLFLAGKYQDAWEQYKEAFSYNKRTALQLNFLRKAIKSWLRK
ncbi:glycosyltransferase family 2 protein [Endozoicomonas sp. Mp262]|uniref:glycosyltransferase family 2 protein n=1 Tax=Endozoicomonas sp. Mp262 TaxID=2919499 RepID=UPI0021D934B3